MQLAERLTAATLTLLAATLFAANCFASTPTTQRQNFREMVRRLQQGDVCGHGVCMQFTEAGDRVTVVATADLEDILRSQAFWGTTGVHLNNEAFDHAIYTIAYCLIETATIAAMHQIFAVDSKAKSFHATLSFRLLGRNSQPKIGTEFYYDRAADASRYTRDNPYTQNASEVISNPDVASWLITAVKSENDPALKVLEPEAIALDNGALTGQPVRVRGLASCDSAAPICLLYPRSLDLNAPDLSDIVFFHRSLLSDQDGSRLISCSLTTFCTVIVYGIVAINPFKVIEVTSVTWDAITIEDYILDRHAYQGQIITVLGKAGCQADYCSLQESDIVGRSIYFHNELLPRADRKRLLECAQGSAEGCDIELTGQVKEDDLQALRVVWK